jgi:hypothetical protein
MLTPRPQLEQLESRLTPSTTGDWDVVQVDVPQNFTAVQASLFISFTINSQVFLAQFNLSAQFSSHRLYEFNCGNQLYSELTHYGPQNPVQRSMAQFAGGQVPYILATSQDVAARGGLQWEEANFENGWWFQDAPGDNRSTIPPGPQWGREFQAPSTLWMDWLILTGTPLWNLESQGNFFLQGFF